MNEMKNKLADTIPDGADVSYTYNLRLTIKCIRGYVLLLVTIVVTVFIDRGCILAHFCHLKYGIRTTRQSFRLFLFYNFYKLQIFTGKIYVYKKTLTNLNTVSNIS